MFSLAVGVVIGVVLSIYAPRAWAIARHYVQLAILAVLAKFN